VPASPAPALPPIAPTPRSAAPWFAAAAAALPSLLAYNVAPSPTFLNQALAFALWPAFAMAVAPLAAGRGAVALQGALALLVAAGLWSWLGAALPASLALSLIGSLLAAAVMVAGGSGARARLQADDKGTTAVDLFAAFCWGWVVSGGLNVAIAAVQVFWPGVVDGDWIAHSGFPGRAVGNLRQPNHLSSLLLWSCIAVVVLLQLGRLRGRWAAALFASFVFAVVLTASRTGLVSVVLLAVWGGLDRRLARPVRGLLIAAPLVYAASWLGMAQWAAASAHSFGGTERLAETDISSSRFAIWRDTLALIRQQPWTGVGFGEFNFAWTLTPSPHRPTALFDHTHNLPLQLAVELGLPLALLVTGLLVWALWQGARRAWLATGDIGTAQRSAMVMVLMIALHSLLEYPLWYSYFLLPAAWAWGFALWQAAGPAVAGDSAPAVRAGGAAFKAQQQPSLLLAVANVVVVLAAALAVLDYGRVTAIFSAEEGAAPLDQRIAAGQRSVLFAHHADYAAATSGVISADPAHDFDRATHYLLDTRLMVAWSRSLAARGHLDAARYVAERLREFRKSDAETFFEACPAGPTAPPSAAAVVPASAASAASAPSAADAFACERPVRAPGWRELAAR
jgi:O-antigen ligase